MKKLIFGILILTHMTMFAQENTSESDYYAAIPNAPETFTPGTVISRMIDGLGFRYYWAVQGLTEDDLNYRPSKDGRTLAQTLDHIYGLSGTIVSTAKKQPSGTTKKREGMTFDEKIAATLDNFKVASGLFLRTEDLSEHKIIFKRPQGTSEFPFWNQINGPIEDAIWHTGQVVVLRRAAGNPINPKVNVFLGKLND
ncbi:DinB family protein [Maribacter sp. 2304DJ31-5]|uniref:DinB family protein n=1 Tax=Maribacter sp. 2304DJ31-5 TaxID=3386273 RepID=UPI0039BD27AF